MQAITMAGAAACLGVLYFKARKARGQRPSSTKRRFKTAHLLVGAVLAWLLINFELQHLSSAISGEPKSEPSTWERVVRTAKDWGFDVSLVFPDAGFGGRPHGANRVSVEMRPQGRQVHHDAVRQL